MKNRDCMAALLSALKSDISNTLKMKKKEQSNNKRKKRKKKKLKR